MRFTLDMTPWVRGPYSGIGLCAFHVAQALKQENLAPNELYFVRKDQKSETELESRLGSKIHWLNPFRRWSGSTDEVYHSFALQLPEVKHSRRVVTIWDCWTLEPNEYQDKKFQKVQAKKMVDALKRAHAIVTAAQSVREKLGQWNSSLLTHTYVVPFASTVEKISPTLGAGVRDLVAPVQNYLLENRDFVLVVGSLETRKNHKLIFKAMKSTKDLDLVMVGKPGFGVEKVMEDLGDVPSSLRVEHFQEIDDQSLAALYDRCKAVVSASKDEGFGMPLVEAMCRGKPLLLSKIPVHEEVAGSAALYFDLDQGDLELKEFLEALKTDPYVQRDLSERSKKRSELFSWEKTAKGLLEVYKKV